MKYKTMNTRQIVLASRPKGRPAMDNFRFEDTSLPEIQEGEVLLQGVYYSVDPYMRGRMNETPSYIPPFQMGQPIEGGVIAKVSASNAKEFKAGDIVLGSLPWRIQTVAPAKGLQKIDATSVAPSYYLGILGMPGLAAFFGLTDIGKPKAGETVVVSGAAGAVGLAAGQIAKIYGCRVVGITGSEEKVKFLKNNIGFDEVINYKATGDISAAVAKLCPNGVNVYFDNVGCEISDAVLANLAMYARVPLCGQISLYNSTEITLGPRVQPILLSKSALMQGFLANNYQDRFADTIKQLTQWESEGRLKNTETIVHGFDQLPAAFLGLFKGDNTGKMIVEATQNHD